MTSEQMALELIQAEPEPLLPVQPPWWTDEDEAIADSYRQWWNGLGIDEINESLTSAWGCRCCYHWSSDDGVAGLCHAGMEDHQYADCPVPPFPTSPTDTCEMFTLNGPRRFTAISGAEYPAVRQRLTEAQRAEYVENDWRPRPVSEESKLQQEVRQQ